jgi:hypothetical protein
VRQKRLAVASRRELLAGLAAGGAAFILRKGDAMEQIAGTRILFIVLVKNKKEPWGQTGSRFLGPEGLLVGITFTPWMRESKNRKTAEIDIRDDIS